MLKISRNFHVLKRSVTYCKSTLVSCCNHTLLSKKYAGGFSFENEDDWDSSFDTSFDSNTNSQSSFNDFQFNESRFNDRFDIKKTRFNPIQIEWSKENLIPFKKDFYRESDVIRNRSEEEISNFREKNGIKIFGGDAPRPFYTWEESGIPKHCFEHVQRLGISEPTAIQQQGIPMALSGRDVVGISRTGSGKTLAYLLPAIVHIHAQPLVKLGEGPIALVLAPTRELTQQINEEINKFVQTNRSIQLKHAAVFGGSDRHKQIHELRQSPDIIVGTPGRLMDLLECGETNFKRLTYLVMDEADRMLDMGFREDLETILSYVRPDKQVLCWSATWPKEIQNIANEYMNNPIRVQIGSLDLHANQNIKQYFKICQDNNNKLQQFMKDINEINNSNRKCLVFTNTKRDADYLENVCQSNSIRARSIHGDKTQSNRENTLKAFRNGNISVLIATNVVARGIDISDINVVLNYDFPQNIEDYVHRIGRTARGNDTGMSLSYLNNSNIDQLGRDLQKLLIKSNQKVPQFLENLPSSSVSSSSYRGGGRGGGNGGRRSGSGRRSLY